MTEQRIVSVTLDDELASVIDQAIAHGGYSSREEVVREALAAWYRHRTETPDDIARLQSLIDEGLASGDGGEVTDEWFDDIKRRGRERLASTSRAA